MMASMTNLSSYSYNFVSSSSVSSKLYVPVKPSNVIYAQFNHISGVAAKNGQTGVSISKIRILNSLIENFTRLKTNSANNPEVKETNLSSEQVDALIKTYQEKLESALAMSEVTPYVLQAKSSISGQLFSLSV